jgi:hypothetical protein
VRDHQAIPYLLLILVKKKPPDAIIVFQLPDDISPIAS